MPDLDLLETLWNLPTLDHDPDEAALESIDSAARSSTPLAQPEQLSLFPEVPVLDGLQRQGDLLVIPFHALPHVVVNGLHRLGLRAPVALDAERALAVLAGEHRHQLLAQGAGEWESRPNRDGTQGRRGQELDNGPDANTTLGVLTVENGAVAFLEHTGHHAALAIGPGRYVLRRQRAAVPDTQPTPQAGHVGQVGQVGQVGPGRSPGVAGAPRWRTVWD